jgi:hypothetical protein
MNDIGASDHKIRVAEINMGTSVLIPGNDPVAVPEKGRLGDNTGHFRLHRQGHFCRMG